MILLDIHSHRPAPYPQGILSVDAAAGFVPVPGQYYSAGLHPWHLASTPLGVQEQCAALGEVASHPQVIAVGEAGFDALRGAPMALQTLAFRAQVELSEQLGKPLVIHSVKTLDMIVGWRRESRASQPWILHGFRGKPAMVAQLLRAGCFISFGPRFNPASVAAVPDDALFAETDDDASADITDVIAALSEVRGYDLLPVIVANMQRLFNV